MAATVKPSMRKNEQDEDKSDSARTRKDEAIEEILKAMDDLGLTFDDILNYCERKCEKVRRVKTKFRERRLSSGLEMMVREKDDGVNGVFSEWMEKL